MNQIKKLLIKLLCPEYYDMFSKVNSLEIEISSLNNQVEDLFIEKKESDNLIVSLNEDKNNLLDTLNNLKLEDEHKELQEELEEYWNNKRPKISRTYNARPLFDADGKFIKTVSLDPRAYYDRIKPEGLVTFAYKSNDYLAEKCLDWVARNITYTSESKEFWQFSFETLMRKKGDCEDGAILMANMMLFSGIPYWRIRLNAGNVKGGGHAYVTYLAEKDNEWYVLDWCYWYDESKGLKKKWNDAEKYFGIWFSWNRDYIFGDLPKEE